MNFNIGTVDDLAKAFCCANAYPAFYDQGFYQNIAGGDCSPIAGMQYVKNSSRDMAVALFFVKIDGTNISADFYACADSTVVGPFMPAGTAIEWRNQFYQNGTVFSRWNNEPGVCADPPLMNDMAAGWHRSSK